MALHPGQPLGHNSQPGKVSRADVRRNVPDGARSVRNKQCQPPSVTMLGMSHLPLTQINIIVSDMDAALRFYRHLGWDIVLASDSHAVADLPGGVSVDFDTQEFAGVWDHGYSGGTGGTTVLGVTVGSREAVDATFAELSSLGRGGRQEPYDAFWGARYAIVEDPDGNPVGIMSPVDPAARSAPLG